MGKTVHFRKGNRQSSTGLAMLVPAMFLGGLVGYNASDYVAVDPTLSAIASPQKTNAPGACNIKGNISVNTGERIYHVPGQTYYSATHISLAKGERWFCSEADARRAGWRKSKV